MGVKGTGPFKTYNYEFKGETKRCPFLATSPTHMAATCMEEECMLWNEEKQTCNINVIAESKR